MKLWFEWNGIDSREMNVLMSKVPDIVKPKKRANETYIDGCDGSNVDDLGYASYQKAIEIGFMYDDVKEVEQWLNGAGKLRICNEPDFYYDAKIIDEIRYKKDIIFCKATINFYVHPVKHFVYDEEEIGESFVYVYNDSNINALPRISITGSGNIDLAVNDVKACTIKMAGANDTVVIDSEIKECMRNGNLANRSMLGEFPELVPEENKISCIGAVSSMKVKVNTRWV